LFFDTELEFMIHDRFVVLIPAAFLPRCNRVASGSLRN
jgi:hypothetical protein